jgi:sulfur-carrier protein
MEITVTVPALRDCVGGRTTFAITGAPLDQALRRMRETYPLLRVHLFDEAEQLRPHVLIFYNAESIAWLERLDVALQPGDRLDVLQAVSGG